MNLWHDPVTDLEVYRAIREASELIEQRMEVEMSVTIIRLGVHALKLQSRINELEHGLALVRGHIDLKRSCADCAQVVQNLLEEDK